jgi:hypothetical protein
MQHSHTDLNDSVCDLTPDELNQISGGWLGWADAKAYWTCLQNTGPDTFSSNTCKFIYGQ